MADGPELVGTSLISDRERRNVDLKERRGAWAQEVTDKEGRRRFHGAFTGGFSAGYFNTVGSKEGWTPKSFSSSRGDRNRKKFSQNIQDFMDEDDDPLIGSQLEVRLVVKKDSIAKRLLRLIPDGNIKRVQAKGNQYGIGYVPRSSDTLPGYTKKLPGKGRNHGFIGMSGGIGTGVLEEDDDYDVYQQDTPDMYSFSRLRKPIQEVREDEASESLISVHAPFPGFTKSKTYSSLKPYESERIVVPANFIPRHTFGKDEYAPNFGLRSSRRGKLTKLTPAERGITLGEKATSGHAKKLSNLLANRFVTSTEKSKQILVPGLRAMEQAISSQPDSSLNRVAVPTQSGTKPEVNTQPLSLAVPHSRLKLVRTTSTFTPERLLCKRFNVQWQAPSSSKDMVKPPISLPRRTNHADQVSDFIPKLKIFEKDDNETLFKSIFSETGPDENSSYQDSSDEESASKEPLRKQLRHQPITKPTFIPRKERLERAKHGSSQGESLNSGDPQLIVSGPGDSTLPEWAVRAVDSAKAKGHEKKKKEKKEKKKKKKDEKKKKKKKKK